MGIMPHVPTTRRGFRFGVRALLAALTMAAIIAWVYWYGWPRYMIYREQTQFEAAVRGLNPGVEVWKADQMLPTETHRYGAVDGMKSGYRVDEWPDASYFLFFPAADSPHAKNAAFEL